MGLYGSLNQQIAAGSVINYIRIRLRLFGLPVTKSVCESGQTSVGAALPLHLLIPP